MITGFNTDISHEGVTYHVQTEDKGVESAIILSLVYEKGVILAAKRAPYEDLLGNELDVGALEQRLQRQHKLICAAIKAGRIEDLKKLSAAQASVAGADVPSSIPMPDSEPVWDIPDLEKEKPVEKEKESKSDTPSMVSPDSVLVVDQFTPKQAAEDERLKLKLIGAQRFATGERQHLNVLVCRGGEEASVGGANVMIKILGSDFRPLIYHAKADQNGIAAVMVKIPNFRSGRAAIMIRAIVGSEEAELRRPIAHQR